MFATTPRLRDRLDVRTVALVALIAAGGFGLQLTFLAGTVASPLGEAIADLDRIPQFQPAPAQALAAVDGAREERPALTRLAPLPWEATAAIERRLLPQECLVQR
jgi:hypothetical protein